MHQPYREDQQPGPLKETESVFNLIVSVVLIHALVGEVFLRRPGSFGDRYLRSPIAAWPILTISIFALFWSPPEGAGAVLCILPAYLMLLVVNSIKQRHDEHSMFTGTSWLGSDCVKAKGRREPAFVLLLALFACPLPALCMYLFTTALALAVQSSMLQRRDESLRRAARDARREGDFYGRFLDEQD